MVDKAASELARKRWEKATSKQRAEAAQKMLEAKSPEERAAIANKAAAKRWANKQAAAKAKDKTEWPVIDGLRLSSSSPSPLPTAQDGLGVGRSLPSIREFLSPGVVLRSVASNRAPDI